MNDIDIEYNEAVATANSMSRATKKHGICFHNGWKTRPIIQCNDCKKIFATEDDLLEEHVNLTAEWC